MLVFSGSMLFSQNIQFSVEESQNTGASSFYESSIKGFPESDKIWLNLHNDQGAFSQILIGFIEGATNQIDRNYDGLRFFGSNPVAFYSIVDSVKLAIQGRELRTGLEIIPLGVYSTITEQIILQISIDELQGQLNSPEIEILLKDSVSSVEHDLKASSYSFELLQEGTFDDRFNLIIRETGVLNLDHFENGHNLILTTNEGQLTAKTKDKKNILSFMAFDFLGRKLIEISPNKNQFSTNIVNIKDGTILLIKVILENNQHLFKKIILHN